MHTAWPAAGFPIRIFPVQSLMTASRDFSQSSTSFIGSICQGIHFVPLSTFLCIDWIGSWIFNSKVGVNLPSILTLVEKDIRYCSSICINKYLNEITNINLIILRLKHKLLNYCACHTWQSVARLHQDYINHKINDVPHRCGRVHIGNFNWSEMIQTFEISICILQHDLL